MSTVSLRPNQIRAKSRNVFRHPSSFAEYYLAKSETKTRSLLGRTYYSSSANTVAKTSPKLVDAVSSIIKNVNAISMSICSCQFLKTLQNFALPGKLTNWRGEVVPEMRGASARLLSSVKRRGLDAGHEKWRKRRKIN